MVVPEALQVLRLKPARRHCLLGRLASEFGWKHAHLIEKMEDKRRVKAAEFYAKKKSLAHQRALAENEADLSAVLPKLEQFGHYITPSEPMEDVETEATPEDATDKPAAAEAEAEPAAAPVEAAAAGGDY